MEELEQRLEYLKDRGLYRRLRMVSGPQGPRVVLDGTPVLLLCSNNYLGLSDHPKVREAAADAAMRWGVGAGSSRLVSGSMTIHRRLEERLAGFVRSESALLFGSGYLATLGSLQALGSETSLICADEHNDAALVDGCQMAGVPVFTYRHRDLEHLAWGLREQVPSGTNGRPLIVTESVFGNDGAVAPLRGIVELARRFGARTLVNEAHALGCVGPGGRGAVAAAGLERDINVLIGSLDHALGSYGGFVAGDATLTRFLLNTARTLQHSAAPAPPAVAGALAGLELLQAHPERAERLQQNAVVLHGALREEGLVLNTPPSHILAIPTADGSTAGVLCERLLERRVFAEAVRPPAVADGRSLLRVTVSASHTPQELRRAATVIADAARELGLPVGAGPSRPSITRADDALGVWSAAPARGTAAGRPSVSAANAAFFDVEQLDPAMLRAHRSQPFTGSVLGR